jgi:hypothetical protein
MYIARHKHGWNPNDFQEQLDYYAEDLQDALAKVSKQPGNLSSLLGVAIDYAGYLSVLEPTSFDLWRTLRIAAYTAKCIFLLADRSITEEYDLDVGEGPLFSFPQTGPTSYSHSGTWEKGYYLGFACREQHILDSQVMRSTDIARQSSTTSNEYGYLMIDALKSFYASRYEVDTRIEETSDEETSQKLQAALDATDADRIMPETIDGTINIALPEMELLACLLENNPQHFNESLADALECHKKYWSSSEDMAGDPRGFIAIGPLGLACAAYDLGFPIEIESEYIPKYILEKQYRPKQKAS